MTDDDEPIDVNCEVSNWGEWSACENGTQTRTRDIVVEQKGCGFPCEELAQTRQCSVPKQASDCQMSEWGEWSECPAECGGGSWKSHAEGMQRRERTIIKQSSNSEEPCGETVQLRKCQKKCPSLFNFDACSNSCPIQHNQSFCSTWGKKCPGLSAGDTLCDKTLWEGERLDKMSLAFRNLKTAELLLQPNVNPVARDIIYS